MDLNNLVSDILKLSCAGVITVSAAYYLIRPDIQKYLKLKFPDLRKDGQQQLLVLRLQAHERLLLFIERINPVNLLVRVHQQGIPVQHLQSVLLQEIRAEYQHNVTQQLYVSPTVWTVVSQLKDDTLAMINHAAQGLTAEEEGVNLGKKILKQIAALTDNPYDLTLELIRKDIQQLF